MLADAVLSEVEANESPNRVIDPPFIDAMLAGAALEATGPSKLKTPLRVTARAATVRTFLRDAPKPAEGDTTIVVALIHEVLMACVSPTCAVADVWTE